MSTIYDIAKEAGVSIATVSRVLNDPGVVSQKTKLIVEAAIERLNYQPNALARELVTKSTGLIGVMMSTITNTFVPNVVDSFSDEVKKRDYNLFICITGADPDAEVKYIDIMMKKRIEAMIVLGMRQLDSKANEALKKVAEKIPVVLVESVPLEGIHTITADEERGAYMAASHLIGLGHEKIAFINGNSKFGTYTMKKRGFERALKEHSIEIREEYNLTADPDFRGGYLGGKQLMALDPPPTAVFLSGDQMAVGMYRAIQEAGKSIPGDVSVIGYSGSPLSEFVYPTMTTVDQYARETGYEAFSMLWSLLEKKDVSQHRVMRPRILERGSCRDLRNKETGKSE